MVTRSDIYNQYGLGNKSTDTDYKKKWGFATSTNVGAKNYLKYDEAKQSEAIKKVMSGLDYDLTKQNTF